MKNTIMLVLLLASQTILFAQGSNYELVWADEFNGTGVIDTDKWFHQTQLPNGYSWYNDEIQHYTDRTSNSFVNNGTLKIVAKEETFTDQGVTKTHTSARLNSKFAFTYGYVEIRAKLPTGIGTWPAIWTLGQNITEPGGYWTASHGNTSWPACGEIDIMEHWGHNQNYVQSATHTPSSFGNTQNHGGQVIGTASTDFHIYGLEWTPDRLVFSVDGTVHYIYEPNSQNADTWPFDANQYILLNVAMLPNVLPSFTASAMEIDYVRIFQDPLLSTADETTAIDIRISPNPAQDTLRLQVAPVLMGSTATLYSMIGQELTRYTVGEEQTFLNISSYAKGTYVLIIEKDQSRYVEKFVKQ